MWLVVTVLVSLHTSGEALHVTLVDDYNRTSIVYFTHFVFRGLSLNAMKDHKVWSSLLILLPKMQCFTPFRGYVVHKFDDLITGILIIRLYHILNHILMQFILLNIIPAINWKILRSLTIIRVLSIPASLCSRHLFQFFYAHRRYRTFNPPV
jgi:hypothetical protein